MFVKVKKYVRTAINIKPRPKLWGLFCMNGKFKLIDWLAHCL